MSKDDIITLAFDYQDRFNSNNISKDIGEVKYKFEKLESELVVSKSVNSNLCKRITTLESHNVDLDELFPNNELIKDIQRA